MPPKKAKYRGGCGWCGAGRDHERWIHTRSLSRTGYAVEPWRDCVLPSGVRLPAQLPREQGGSNSRLCSYCYFTLRDGALPLQCTGRPDLLLPELLLSSPPQAAGLVALSAAAERLDAQPPGASLSAAIALPDARPPATTPSANFIALHSLSSAAVEDDMDVGKPTAQDAVLSADWWETHRYAHDSKAIALCSQHIRVHLQAVVMQVTRVVAQDISAPVDVAPALRIIGGRAHQDLNSEQNWAALLTAERHVAARPWRDEQPLVGDEKDCWLEHIARFDAGVNNVVYSDFPQGPPGLRREQLHDARRVQAETSLAAWMADLKQREQNTPLDVGHGRTRLQTLSDDRGKSLNWDDGDALRRDLLNSGQPELLPAPLQAELLLHTGQQLYIFFTAGGSGNGAHKDPVGGYSTLATGWKVFIWWDAADGGLFINSRRQHLGIRLSRAATTPSLRWTLLGPGDTIFLHPDCIHAVITLSSSALVTQCRTFLPHRLIRSICLILTGKVHDDAWLHSAAADVAYPAVLNFLVDATDTLLTQWRQFNDRPDMARSRMLMENGWLHLKQDFQMFLAAQRYKPMDGRQLNAAARISVQNSLRKYELLMTGLKQTVEMNDDD
jgi:hypothetical protein